MNPSAPRDSCADQVPSNSAPLREDVEGQSAGRTDTDSVGLSAANSPALDAPALDAPALDAPALDAPALDAPAVGSLWDGPVIELCNLQRSFGKTRAVDGVSFQVPRGSVFGYIGPNGAGKTTSMRILATLEIPSSGEAFVEGLSSVNDPDRVRTRLGFMPDSFGTYADTNCVEYLDFFARSQGLIGRERTRRLRWVLDFTGVRSLAEKPIRGLSKGMKQRLCLGRALIHDPAVLILDEPAAGLDPHARIELRQIIRTLAAENKTILISSHILTELSEMCDRVGILEQGRLLATGTVDEIRKTMNRARGVRVRVSGSTDAAMKLLSELDGDLLPSCEADLIHFSLSGGASQQIEILRRLCEARIEVLEYSAKEETLEDVFLYITQGRVQ